MGRAHYRITLADAEDAHELAISFGGLPGTPNRGLVEAAIARPYSGYYRSIARKAAALLESVALNHGFADGNKRTAVILVHTLIRRSGYDLVAASPNENLEDAFEEIVLAVVTRKISFDQLSEWFKARICKS